MRSEPTICFWQEVSSVMTVKLATTLNGDVIRYFSKKRIVQFFEICTCKAKYWSNHGKSGICTFRYCRL
jgi:hypothetical protein